MLKRLPALDRNHVCGVCHIHDDLHTKATVESARVREDVKQRARSVLEVVGRKAQVEEGGDSHAGDASTRTPADSRRCSGSPRRCWGLPSGRPDSRQTPSVLYAESIHRVGLPGARSLPREVGCNTATADEGLTCNVFT